jgi:hypothetical protein
MQSKEGHFTMGKSKNLILRHYQGNKNTDKTFYRIHGAKSCKTVGDIRNSNFMQKTHLAELFFLCATTSLLLLNWQYISSLEISLNEYLIYNLCKQIERKQNFSTLI